MASLLTFPKRWASPIAFGILALTLSAAVTTGAAADDSRVLIEQGDRAQKLGRLSIAAEKFAAAAELSPENVEILLRLALVRGYLREYEAALAAADRGLAIEPRNTDLKLARSRILSWAGRYDEAWRMADAVTREQPQNAEALAVKGRIEFYQGRLRGAEASFSGALALAPDNVEAKAGLADVARARQALAERTDGGAGGAPPRWRIDAGYLHSHLSRAGFSDWREGFLRIQHSWPSDTAASLRVDVSNRFDTTEKSAGLGIAQRFSPALYGYLTGAVAPDADFLPRWDVAAGGSIRIHEGRGAMGAFLLTAAVRHRHYASGDLQNIEPGIEQYAFDGRLWLAVRWINVFDRASDLRLTGWNGRLDWQVAPAFRLYAGMSDVPEMEGGVIADTQTRFGGLAVDLAPSLLLTINLAREDRENSYIRNVYGTALTLRY